MSARERAFRYIDGVPLYYWRRAPVGVAKPYTFYGTDELYERLVVWKRDLDAYTRPAGYGRTTRIVSAGAQVGKSGAHGRGLAFDIDQVRWSTGRSCTPYKRVHRSKARVYRLRYFALDAVCRQHFHWVLDANYDSDHHDHIHVDMDSLPVRLDRGSRSDTVFIQAICNLFAGEHLDVDGDWGPKTAAGLKRAVIKAGLAGVDPRKRRRDYQKFMQRVSQKGFRGEVF